MPVVSSLHVRAFALWAGLSGLVPRIAIVKGRCFAGNAVIAGCADLIVATEDASIGMGGPAMIAGGGLGEVAADDVGPIDMQAPNGVVDVVVADEAEAVAVTYKEKDAVTDAVSALKSGAPQLHPEAAIGARSTSLDVALNTFAGRSRHLLPHGPVRGIEVLQRIAEQAGGCHHLSEIVAPTAWGGGDDIPHSRRR